MNTVLKIKKAGHSMSPQEGVDAIVMDIGDLTNRFRERSIDYARRVGNLLIDLKQESKAAGLKWGRVCQRLPFSDGHARKFMTIARNEALADRSHVNDLPTDTATLYNLARLPAPELEQHIKAGSVHAEMTRKEVTELTKKAKRTDGARLASGDKPKEPKPKPAKSDRPKLVDVFKKAHPNERMRLIHEQRDWFARHLDEIMRVVG